MQQVARRAAHAGQAGAGEPACRRVAEKLTSVPEDRIQPSAINSAPTLLPPNTIMGPQ
jgi:hypothetical protein